MFKYTLGQEVWLMCENKVCCGKILARHFCDSEVAKADVSAEIKKEIRLIFQNIGELYCVALKYQSSNDLNYSTGCLSLSPSQLFPSKQELISSL